MKSLASRWSMPVVGLAIGAAISLAGWLHYGSVLGSVLGFAITCAYVGGVVVLRTRSETATLLTGIAVDERWASINERALSAAAQLMALILVAALIVVNIAGGDPMPYAQMAVAFAIAYLGGILWFRWRS